MIIFVHFYFPFSVHCYIIIYTKIAELENKEILKTIKEKKISAQELIGFLNKMPEGVTLENVANVAFRRIPPHSGQIHFNNTD